MTNDALDPALWVKLSDDPLGTGVVRRRVLPKLPHDVFIGETRPSRNRVLELSVLGRATNMPKEWRQSKGLQITVDTTDPCRTTIRLRSLTRLGDPLFEELARDVISMLVTSPQVDAATRVVERVIGWQEFFAREGEPFSPERAAGLFGELQLLSSLIIPCLGADTAVHGWTGPDPALQDYQFGGLAIEVKTYRGTGPGQMRISSERQLDIVGASDLYIAFFTLDQRQDGTGMTLVGLLNNIRDQLRHSLSASHSFESKLISSGWLDSHSEFRNEHYVVRSVEHFRVVDGFPRLVPSDIPHGVSHVSYLVERSALDQYVTQPGELTKLLGVQL